MFMLRQWRSGPYPAVRAGMSSLLAPPSGLPILQLFFQVFNCLFQTSQLSVISISGLAQFFFSVSLRTAYHASACGDRCSMRSRVAVNVPAASAAKGAIPRSSGLRCPLRMAPRAFLQFYCSDFPFSRLSILSFSEQQAGGHTRQFSILFAVFHSISAILRMSIVSLSGPTHCSLFLSQRPIARRRAVTIAAGVRDEWQPMFMLPQRPRGPYPQLWAEMSSLYQPARSLFPRVFNSEFSDSNNIKCYIMSRRAATVAQQVLSDGSGCSCCVRELGCLLCRTFPNLPFFHGSSFQVLPFSALNYVSCLNESAATHCCLFPTSLCGVLVLLAAIPPASALPSFLPSVLLAPSSTHSLTHPPSHSLTHCTLTLPAVSRDSLTHSLTHSLHSPTHPHSLTHSPTHPRTHSAVSRDCRRGCGARGRRWGPGSLRSGPCCPETAEGAAARVVAAGGPALRDCRRGCGARGRRWGPGSLRSGRRSLRRLQKGPRRAWSPLGAPAVLRVTAILICKAMVVTGCESHCNGCGKDVRTLCLCTTAIVISTAHSLTHSPTHPHTHSAVSRDCRRWPAQCPETAEGAAARVVAAEAGSLRRASALFAVSRDCRRGCGARGWGPGSLRRGSALFAVSRDLQKGLRRAWLGARLSPQWPAQSPERLSHSCAAVSRDCRRATHSLTHCTLTLPAVSRDSLTHSLTHSPTHPRTHSLTHPRTHSAVSRDCRRGCGARGRRWGPGSLRSGRRSVQRLQKGLRRAWSPLGARLSPQRFALQVWAWHLISNYSCKAGD